MRKTNVIKKPRFVIFFTGEANELSFNDVYDFELTKKDALLDGNGFTSWVEFDLNNELVKVYMD